MDKIESIMLEIESGALEKWTSLREEVAALKHDAIPGLVDQIRRGVISVNGLRNELGKIFKPKAKEHPKE